MCFVFRANATDLNQSSLDILETKGEAMTKDLCNKDMVMLKQVYVSQSVVKTHLLLFKRDSSYSLKVFILISCSLLLEFLSDNTNKNGHLFFFLAKSKPRTVNIKTPHRIHQLIDSKVQMNLFLFYFIYFFKFSTPRCFPS